MLTSFPKVPSESSENECFRLPHCRLTPPLQGTPMNICINILPESRIIGLHLRRWQYGSIFMHIFVLSSERCMCFETGCAMAFQGHPRTHTHKIHNLGPRLWILCVCDFLLVINSNLGPILPCFRDIAGFLLEWPHPYSTRILGCSLGLDCRCCGSEERRP